MAQIVAVQQNRPYAPPVQLALQGRGDGRLARTGQTGEPDGAALVAVQAGSVAPRDGLGGRIDVPGLAQGGASHARRRNGAGLPVDQDEAAHGRIVRERIERNGRRQSQFGGGDLVQVQARGIAGLGLGQGDPDRQGPAADADPVGAVGGEATVVHPQQAGREPLHRGRPGVRQGQDVAARHIDLLLQHQGHRVARLRRGPVAFPGHDARDGRRHA